VRWEAAAATDVGRVRPQNEDAYLLRPDLHLYAVADGMGGHAAGEVASRLAIETLAEELASLPPATPGPDVEAALRRAVQAANRAILERAAREPDKAGMGTTLTALRIVEQDDGAPGYRIAHVGDSRAYRLRAGTLELLTRDHTWVQLEVERGTLTPELARVHPFASVLVRAVGIEPEAEPDLLRGRIEPGDLYLLCSDGLTTALEDRELKDLLDATAPLQPLARRLVDAANERGGPDNITVVLLRAA